MIRVLLYIVFVTLFLRTNLSFSQTDSFNDYLKHFKTVKRPLKIDAEVFEKIPKNTNFINDSLVTEFIGPKKFPAGELHYLHLYYACPIKNDSIIALMYLKTAPVQGELWLIEIALYNSKTKTRIDKMLLAHYNLSSEKESEFSNESVIECFPADIRKDLSIKTQTGLFIPTLNGFKVKEGIKEEATNW